MKRAVVLLLALAMLFTLAACGSKKCDVCGESKKCETIEILGEKMNICEDCMAQVNSLAGSMLGGMDIDVGALLG